MKFTIDVTPGKVLVATLVTALLAAALASVITWLVLRGDEDPPATEAPVTVTTDTEAPAPEVDPEPTVPPAGQPEDRPEDPSAADGDEVVASKPSTPTPEAASGEDEIAVEVPPPVEPEDEPEGGRYRSRRDGAGTAGSRRGRGRGGGAAARRSSRKTSRRRSRRSPPGTRPVNLRTSRSRKRRRRRPWPPRLRSMTRRTRTARPPRRRRKRWILPKRPPLRQRLRPSRMSETAGSATFTAETVRPRGEDTLIAANGDTTCAVIPDGGLSCWGAGGLQHRLTAGRTSMTSWP